MLRIFKVDINKNYDNTVKFKSFETDKRNRKGRFEKKTVPVGSGNILIDKEGPRRSLS